MPRVEKYQLFKNSQDFEKIFKESCPAIRELQCTVDRTFEKAKQCMNNKSIYLLYNDENEVIGFCLYEIKNRVFTYIFDYVSKKNRNRKHGRYFRNKLFEIFKDEVDKIEFCINHRNKLSFNSVSKVMKKHNLQIKKVKKILENILEVRNQQDYEVHLKPLDNTGSLV
jgi:hypothetical protein